MLLLGEVREVRQVTFEFGTRDDVRDTVLLELEYGGFDVVRVGKRCGAADVVLDDLVRRHARLLEPTAHSADQRRITVVVDEPELLETVGGLEVSAVAQTEDRVVVEAVDRVEGEH